MLDLSFVRDHLEIVEAKLRARGMDPDALLGNFRELDQVRRSADHPGRDASRRNGTSLARRWRAAVRRAPRTSQITAVMDQTRELKQETEELERGAAQAEKAIRDLLASIPNLTQDSVPAGQERSR